MLIAVRLNWAASTAVTDALAGRGVRVRRRSGGQGVLGLFGHGGEGDAVVVGDIRQHLAVDLDPGLLQPIDQPAVGQAVLAGGRVDTGDPQGAELALLLAAVAVGILAGLDDRLLGDTKDLDCGHRSSPSPAS